MTGPFDETQIERMSITLSVGVTVTLTDGVGNPHSWIKPGAESTISWKGIPTPEMIDSARRYIQGQVLEPTITEAIDSAQQRADEARRGTL